MRFHLGYQVLTAAVLAILVGLFFGPYTIVLRPIGDIYIMLLQMVVLPYILFSLVHGLGSLSPEFAKKLFQRGWFYGLLLWGTVFAVIFLLTYLIPKPIAVAVDSDAVQKSLFSKEFLNYIIPKNPFYDLVNNIVPAVAIFSLIFGIALMHIPKKEIALILLEKADATMEKIFDWLAVVSPIGAFAHIADVVGTVEFHDLQKLGFYVAAFIVGTLFLALCVVPVILANLTKRSYRQVFADFRYVGLLPFVTGVPSIAFPFIIHSMRKVGRELSHEGAAFRNTTQTVIPFAFSFTQLGNCFLLFLLFFLSFYYRLPFSLSEKALLSFLSIPMSFGNPIVTLNAASFFLKQLQFPEEAVSLAGQTMSVTLNFQVLLNVICVYAFTVLAVYAYYGKIQWRWKKLVSHLGLAFALFASGILLSKVFLKLEDNYRALYMNLSLSEVIEHPPKKVILLEKEAERISPVNQFPRILESGVLRVGYHYSNMPFCYYNNKHELVGYDVAYAYQLARDLDCELILVPLTPDLISEQLNEGLYDIGMSAIIMNEDRIRKMAFSTPYLEQDNVLIVPQQRQREFYNYQEVIAQTDLKIGAIGGYFEVAKRHFPNAKTYDVFSFDELESGQVDAMVLSKIPSRVWCLNHPGFIVVNYGELLGKDYFAFATQSDSYSWIDFVDNWMQLKRQAGFEAKQHDYWINGQKPKSEEPRWSIMRNVLHWVK